MSTSTTTGGDTPPTDGSFTKRVEHLEKNDDEQIARGAVMVPDRVDHQGDFIRADTIADLRENFEQRVENGDALPGVMHAVFPEGVELVEDRQLEDAETIGEKELPAGTWVQAWRYTDDDLWELVADGVLGGNSIGGKAKGVTYDPGTLPDDVEIPDPVQERLDEAGLSRDDIMVREITEGRIMEVSAVDYPAVPDATHEEHKSLAKASPVLTENVVAARLYLEARGHSEEDARRLAEYLNEHKAAADGLIARAKAWIGGRDDGTARQSSPRPAENAGHTLSERNATDSSTETSDERAESRAGPRDTDDMTDKNEPPEWAQNLIERVEQNADRLDDLASDAEDEEKSTDTEPADADGEEKSESPAWATDLLERVDANTETVERLAEANGLSQQGADTGGNGEETSKEDHLAQVFGLQ